MTQLKTAMPSIKVVPGSDASYIGYRQVQRAFGPGSTGPLQIVTPAGQAARVAKIAQSDRGVAALMPTQTANGYVLITTIPNQDPSNPAVGQTIDRLRAELPKRALVGGAVVENHDLQTALSAKTPLVIGVVLALEFLLLLVALQAPLLAAVGVLTNLLATGADLAAVHGLAAASGHPVQIPPAPATGPSARSTNTASVVAFAIGAALIVLAWAASLRARPPRLRRRKRASARWT